LEAEYQRARELLDRDLGLDPSRVTVVPGNHDLYTRGALESRRFEAYLGPYLASDLPELAVDVGGGRFPVVKLRGELVILGLSSAVPRPPFVAAGELGEIQLAALGRALAHPEVARRTTVIALHHPAVDDRTGLRARVQGLRDASGLVDQLRPLAAGLLLHGHLHRRAQRNLAGRTGVLQVGATSASLDHDDPDRMAGFNLYTLEPGAAPRVEAHVYSPSDGSFHVESVPKQV
ncbi:MAG TPA: metallophosphoesterase, partial [Polyangiaceae bacterium]